MQELTETWLENINEEFHKKNTPHKQRPWLASREWAKRTGGSISLDDEVTDNIFAWFEKNTRIGSQNVGSLYTGVFYYDSCFWPVIIPVVYGTVKLDIWDSLKTIPKSIATRLKGNQAAVLQYTSLWTYCAEYAFSIDDIKKKSALGDFTKELMESGDQQLRATVTLLIERQPNQKAMESARMATEMFLKMFLAGKAGLTEKDAKDKIGHKLEVALNKCLESDPKSELKSIQANLGIFPNISDRYKGTDRLLETLWQAYRVAQFSGSAVIRSFSGRNLHETIKFI